MFLYGKRKVEDLGFFQSLRGTIVTRRVGDVHSAAAG